jgi:16S rRNA (guanine527-N7)-methyltransferase
VKHRKDLEGLYRFLSSVEIVADEKQREQFWLYLELLEKWSSKQNLVSKNDVPHLVERHFVPSLYLSTCLPKKIKGPIMDLGSGAGFPGVLIKIIRPDIQITLLDSSRKKTLFLQEVCEQLGLDVDIVCGRCEDYWGEWQEKYQIVIARAVARLKVLLGLATPLLVNGGRLFTIKGLDFEEEVKEIEDYRRQIEIYKPNAFWLDYVNYLQDKYVIDVER